MPIVIALAAYLCLWPVPIHAVRWQPARAPAYAGPFAANTGLTAAHRIDLHGEVGPEHVLVGPDGSVYVGVASGRIVRLSQDGAMQQVVADTGGRPLGLAFDGKGNLIIADARKGLLSMTPDGKQTVLVPAGDGAPLSFPNAVVVASDGTIYVSDSSQRFTVARWGTTQEAALLDVMEQSATGRVIAFDPATHATRIIATGLSLANGIALTDDEQSLLVSESGRYRVWKIDVHADGVDVGRQRAGAEVLLDNLPGYPDNLTRGRDGRFWLGLAGPRNGSDALASHPFFRELALRLPRTLLPRPKPYGHVVAFTENGTITEDLQDPSGHAPTITGLTETAQRRYLHNVHDGALAWIESTEAAPAPTRHLPPEPRPVP
jgi:sugar lactone lactonase YvrE